MWRLIAAMAAMLGIRENADASPTRPGPLDEEVAKILSERIEEQGQGVGIAVGIIDENGRRVISHGHLTTEGKRSVDGDTVFEIGSITKTFTALLLADMARRGEVALDDPVAKYVRKDGVPSSGRTPLITLTDLATHTAGLPAVPDNFAPDDPANPYVDYSLEQLEAFLSGHSLRRGWLRGFEYSNIGYGMLGHALALHAGMDYESLVRTRITEPLGMESTRIALTPELQSRLATGHDPELKPASNWDLPTLPGAGALRSTANDLLNLLEVVLGYRESELATAFPTMLQVRRWTGRFGLRAARGWFVEKNRGDVVVWHNGGTGGYSTFMGYSPKAKVGVVVLSNTFAVAGVDDIGLHLLNSKVPLAEPPKKRTVAAIDPKIYSRYVGHYRLAKGFILVITRTDNRLFAQATGQPKFEIYPESKRSFFYRVVDAQVTFEIDGAGRVHRLVLHQNGRNLKAPRMDDANRF